MQIVIEIDEEDKEDIGNIHFIREDLKFKIGKAIMNGIPLPKGHGKIIDVDYAIKQILSLPKNELSTEDMWTIKVLNLAPPIIEADKGE